jgi:hypothetical protein
MVIFVVPPIVLAVASGWVWIGDHVQRRAAVGLASGALAVVAATLLTLLLSQRPSGAWRMDLLPSIPLLYAVFVGEIVLAEGVARRFGLGVLGRVVGSAVGGLGLMFVTMVLLVVVMPS